VVVIPFVAYAALTVAGFRSTWAPVLDEGVTLPASVIAALDANARGGADLFVSKSCIACHPIAGTGGRRGPDLSDVGARLPHDRIVTVILTGQGSAMPSYAGSLTPDEVAQLVAFLETRRGR
jgi:ubiquinol-cytochrome c reductase cytochrome b subunit